MWTDVERPEQKMGELCVKPTGKNKEKRGCDEFVEDDCRKIFKEFWRTGNKGMQDTFIRAHVDVIQTVKSKNETTMVVNPNVETVPKVPSKRENSRHFYLKKDGASLEVCKDMFLTTLAISNSKLNSVLKADPENVGICWPAIKKRNPNPSRGFK